MDRTTIDCKYIELFSACQSYVEKETGLSTKALKAHIKKILRTSDLWDIYQKLVDLSVERAYGLSFDSDLEFYKGIDHYDDFIHVDQRDVTGSYYTPQPIVDYMCSSLVQHTWVKNRLDKKETLSILEPSCGTMTFIRGLIVALESQYDSAYIEGVVGQMTTIDIQPQPLILGVLGMILLCHKQLGFLPLWSVYCEDTLKKTSLHKSMDIVFGNPPYLGEKGNGDFFRALKEAPETASYYEGRMDLYYFFIHGAIDALKENGLVSFITTNYFTTADSGKKLRDRLISEGTFGQLTDYSGDGFFKSARGQHNVSFIYEKKAKDLSDTCLVKNLVQDKQGNLSLLSSHSIHENKLYDHKGQINLAVNEAVYDLLEKINGLCDGDLSDRFDVKQGIVSGGDFVTNRILKLSQETSDSHLEKGAPIFVFPLAQQKPFAGPWQGFYKNSDIGAYYIDIEPRYMIYYVNEDNKPSKEGLKYLEQFKFLLTERREVKLGYRAWYELQWPRTQDMFEQPKIVMPQRSRHNVFAYTDQAFYGSADIYYIIHESQDVEQLLYLNGLLNSKLYYYWLFYRGKKKGPLLELYSTPIKNLPLIHYKALDWQTSIVEHVKTIINQKNRKKSEIDSLLYEGFSLSKDEIELVEALYRNK